MSIVIDGTIGINKVQDGIITDTKLNLSANSQEIKDALNAGGSAPIYACRAWVNFNGTNTVAIRGSGNVSSITDSATGNFYVNFNTPIEDSNGCVVVSGQQSSSSNDGRCFMVDMTSNSSCRVHCVETADGLTEFDPTYCFVAVFR